MQRHEFINSEFKLISIFNKIQRRLMNSPASQNNPRQYLLGKIISGFSKFPENLRKIPFVLIKEYLKFVCKFIHCLVIPRLLRVCGCKLLLIISSSSQRLCVYAAVINCKMYAQRNSHYSLGTTTTTPVTNYHGYMQIINVRSRRRNEEKRKPHSHN